MIVGSVAHPAVRGWKYPQMHWLIAIPCLMLTVLIMAYAGRFGAAPIVLLYALWLPQILLKGVRIVMPGRDTAPCLLFSFYAIISVLWSDYPGTSLYFSLEYTSLVVCTIIICRIVPHAVWLQGLVTGCAVTLIATLIDGTYGTDAMGGGASLVGLFGSKNQVGFFAEVGIVAALVLFFTSHRLSARLCFGAGPLLIFLLSLSLSKSASSVISLAGTFAFLFMGYLVTRLPLRRRCFALIFSAGLIAIIVIAGASVGLETFILNSFGKDATLTGRTYLWSEGIRIGLQHPLLGDGYNAFWVQGRPEAERYWYEFQIYSRTGFHFHDLFVQLFVDLGVVGLLLMVWIMLANCWRSFAAVISYGMRAETSFALGLSFMLAIRALVEVDLIGSFGIGIILFYSIIPRLARFRREQAAA